MGLGMSLNIQKELNKTGSPPLHYTNRTISRGEPLADIGGVACASIAELAQISDIIFISVSLALLLFYRTIAAKKLTLVNVGQQRRGS
jgi:3-hydroxyisobutyrate dehydrogenase-like beta-hydroxyacid dehydrogenase